MFYNIDTSNARAQKLVSTATGVKVILSSACSLSINELYTSELVT
jgi:hypothetical protein